MTANNQAKNKHATRAAIERLWSHTVGIANAADPVIGTDPMSGLPAKEQEIPGTGAAGKWGQSTFILTAKHVIEKAGINDLSFFPRPTGAFEDASSVSFEDRRMPIHLDGATSKIIRCDWEDLAIITVDTHALGPYLEFADLKHLWAEPAQGDTVTGLGFPVSAGIIFARRVGTNLEKAVLLNPVGFSGDVLPADTGKYFKGFEPESHYLIPFELSKQGKHPKGISGAAVWLQSTENQVVWTPNFLFSGICTSCYKGGSIELIVKPSVVRKFLLEKLGPPE